MLCFDDRLPLLSSHMIILFEAFGCQPNVHLNPVAAMAGIHGTLIRIGHHLEDTTGMGIAGVVKWWMNQG